MISLFTLYNIIETSKYDYNEEFGGYYLGCDNTKVIFGYYYPFYTETFLYSSLVSYDDVKTITDDIKTHRIVSYKDINIIEKTNIYDLYYRMWFRSRHKKIQLLGPTYTVSNQYKKHVLEANLLLVRDVSILK